MSKAKKRQDSKAGKPSPGADRKPTEEQRAAAVTFLLVGAGVSLALIWGLGQVLSQDARSTLLWDPGRYLGVALFGWIGYSVGLGKGRVVAENLECLAIAVVMALILKHFLIEAYKIPTGSMQPTILGNDESAIFDRVLVNKFAYLVDEPQRYEVIVFKYPLDRSKNYIKRLIGLPGEQVMIFNGDIHTAQKDETGKYGPLHIARKPRSVRESVLKTLYPSGRDGESFADSFKMLSGTCSADGDAIVLSADSSVRFGQGESIRDRYLDGYDPDWGIPAPLHVPEFGSENVSDLALGAEITPADGCREIRLIIFADEIERRAVLGVGPNATTRLESGFRSGEGDGLLPVIGSSTVVAESAESLLTPGKSTEVAFYHIDQELILEIDGDAVLTFDYEISYTTGPEEDPDVYPRPRTSENAVLLEVVGAAATLADVTVRRDIHYLTHPNGSRQLFELPDDCLLTLGDNTQNSSDGRMWAAEEVRFPGGGSTLRERHDRGYDTREFVDIYGEHYRTPHGREPAVQHVDSNRFSFVPENLLLGKAIAVFWPVYPHFRWKLIR